MNKRQCAINYPTVQDATGHLSTGVALVRTAYIAAMNKDDIDDEALAALVQTLYLALVHLDAADKWAFDAHNASVSLEWEAHFAAQAAGAAKSEEGAQ